MPNYISQILLQNGVLYKVKDTEARELIAALESYTDYLGVTTTQLFDGAAVNPIIINGKTVTAKKGNIVNYGAKEYIYSGDIWQQFGDLSALGSLAYKNEVEGTFTPIGTISSQSFEGAATNINVSGIPSGAIVTGSGEVNYTPEGVISTPQISITLATTEKYVTDSSNGGGSVVEGQAAECTLPTLNMNVEDEMLSFSWNDGAFTPNTPTSVILPTFTLQQIATAVLNASSTQPIFSGSGVELSFVGTRMQSTGEYTPEGTVSAPSFIGTQSTITVS